MQGCAGVRAVCGIMEFLYGQETIIFYYTYGHFLFDLEQQYKRWNAFVPKTEKMELWSFAGRKNGLEISYE